MAHAQEPDFVFRRNGRVHLNRQGASVQSTAGSRGVRISGSNGGYTMFRGSVKSTGYPLHSPVSPSLPLPCVTVCHQVSNALYQPLLLIIFMFRNKNFVYFVTAATATKAAPVFPFLISTYIKLNFFFFYSKL